MRRLSEVVCVLVLGLLASRAAAADAPKTDAPAARADAPKADEKIPEVEEAKELFKQGKGDAALASLEAAYKKKPSLGPAQLQLAKMLFAAGNAQQGRQMMEQAAAKHPDNIDVILTFAGIAVGESRIADAHSHYERAWQMASADKALPAAERDRIRQEYHSGLTSVAELRQDWKSAEKNLRAWLAFQPANAKAHLGLARALFFMESSAKPAEKEAAVRAELAKALECDPATEPADVALARFYTQAGDKERAGERMADALRRDAEKPTARVQLAYADWLFRDNRAADALPYARKAVELDAGGKLQARRLLALLLRHKRDYKAAEEIFSELLRESPGDFFLSNQLALTLVEQGVDAKTRRAMELAAVNVRQYPKAAEANSTMGWVFFRAGRTDEAEKYLNAAVSAGQADSDTGYFFCHILSERNRLEDVAKVLEAITKVPGPFVYREEATSWLKRLKPAKP